MPSIKTVTNTIYKAGSAPEVAVVPAPVVTKVTATAPAKTTMTAPGADTVQPAQVGTTANKGVIYKQGAVPVVGKAKY